jgi:hypothetical protein
MIEIISGIMCIISIFMMRVLLSAEMASYGVISPWIVTGYPATVKRGKSHSHVTIL